LPSEKRAKTICGHLARSPVGAWVPLKVKRTATCPFGHHGLDLDPDVGELFVQAREGTLHTFGSASDLGYVGAKLVLFGEQFVRQIQVLPIYHLVDDAPLGNLVLLGSHRRSSSLETSRRVPCSNVSHRRSYATKTPYAPLSATDVHPPCIPEAQAQEKRTQSLREGAVDTLRGVFMHSR
jgi:hypothetical protein